MTSLSLKERLLGVLQKKKMDRPPVACSGGMMNAAIVEIMSRTGQTLPEAHFDDRLMAELAYAVHIHTGFENIGIPFDVTAEADVLGSEISYGSLSCEPKVVKEHFSSVAEVVCRDIRELMNSSRISTIVQAGYRLSRSHPDIPVIGNLTGPITTAASIVDPLSFLKELRKDKDHAHRVIDYICDFLIEYARLLVDNGVDLICIGDPTASGEIVGPKIFEEYAVRYLNKIIDGIHALNAPVILHICGNMNSVEHLIPRIRCDAISTDAMVNLPLLKRTYPQLTTMGNISTYLLEFGPADRIAGTAEKLVRDGVDIISPACGLSTSTTLDHIRALTGAVKGS
ncbi:[methyl-Co(III) methanol-specific corrinoid protein]:coenzyme M methyltransferase [Syntrophus gentianae]|uniref:[methyl-Co(III) methanol-specific corrinoid protein]:coenzyme M methyltransferase n=1 Tax=Syntrophus gentianae TaxID=43775 RepID=A0A1H8AC31_9BACT|nr:uroporphyrinogen decarboxylase family protein [Syntrophus gentianae]SEM68335.1 [methyl-Co(III) methanol-specific corrinoid protein]:coenzyme M methyltransferase [Syntrophus gentianae]